MAKTRMQLFLEKEARQKAAEAAKAAKKAAKEAGKPPPPRRMGPEKRRRVNDAPRYGVSVQEFLEGKRPKWVK